MSRIFEQSAPLAERGGATLAVSGGAWAWLAENAQAIGAVCAIAGVVIALAGFAVNWWYQHHRDG